LTVCEKTVGKVQLPQCSSNSHTENLQISVLRTTICPHVVNFVCRRPW